MTKITLPGSIPGLLRRGSPLVMDCSLPGLVPRRADSCLEALCLDRNTLNKSSHFNVLIEEAGTIRTTICHSDKVFLDLEDPTGRQHAIWWLAEQQGNGNFKYFDEFHFECKGEYSRIFSEFYKFEKKFWISCSGLKIPLSDTGIVVPGMIYPDTSIGSQGYINAINLRAICLHVAGL